MRKDTRTVGRTNDARIVGRMNVWSHGRTHAQADPSDEAWRKLDVVQADQAV